MIAGTSSGVGKTTVTQGILSLFVKNGYNVRSFKLGPDYIDSGYHEKITGKPCINLDKFLLTPVGEEVSQIEIIKEQFNLYASDSDALIIEAVGGLFDDWHKDGNSPYQIAIELGVPVVLVADGYASCQTLGIMLNSLFEYNSELDLAGIIINRVCSEQHFERIIETVKTKYKKRIIGYLLNSKELFINERYLGLTTVPEIKNIKEHIDNLAKTFNKTLSIDSFIGLTKHFTTETSKTVGVQIKKCCKIAVAKDKAFSFYYGYNLDYLRQLGAEIMYFSPLNDSKLPNGTNAVYLGGGFPEVYASKLSKNKSLLTDIKEKINNGMPLYAECGGLIYLGDTIIEFETGINSKTVGVFPFDAYVDSKLTLAYVLGKITKNCLIGKEGDSFKGHVFHQSKVKEKNRLKKHLILPNLILIIL